MLHLDHVSCTYGAIQATDEVDLTVDDGEVVTLIGANGAGKSSTLGAISGLVDHTGTISYEGQPLPQRPAAVVARGIVQVPEGRMVFPELTVEENLLIGAYARRDKAAVRRDMDAQMAMFPVLGERRKSLAANLSGGQQQMLAMARGLMARPKLLMLDEPSLGLAPAIVRDVMATIKQINEEAGVTILLVEQSVGVALEVAHRGYVLERGRIVVSGSSKELRQNDMVRRAYLGE